MLYFGLWKFIYKYMYMPASVFHYGRVSYSTLSFVIKNERFIGGGKGLRFFFKSNTLCFCSFSICLCFRVWIFFGVGVLFVRFVFYLFFKTLCCSIFRFLCNILSTFGFLFPSLAIVVSLLWSLFAVTPKGEGPVARRPISPTAH